MSKDALAGAAAVVSVRPVGEPADAFQRALREERRRSARQINAFRLQALSVFLVVLALLRFALAPAWIGPSFALFGGWWAAAVAYYLAFVFLASFTLERWQIGLAAAVAMTLEALLAALGGVEVGLLVVSL